MSPDAAYLEDMMREAQLALAFIADMSEADFDHDLKTQHAVVRCLEVIGEAANNVSAEIQNELASIPWKDIIAQRHIAIHHYRKLDMRRIRATVQRDLPPLIEVIQRHLS